MPTTLTNGKVTLTLWERIGTTAVQVRTDAAEQQGRVSTLTLPYQLKPASAVPAPAAATTTFVTSNETPAHPGDPSSSPPSSPRRRGDVADRRRPVPDRWPAVRRGGRPGRWRGVRSADHDSGPRRPYREADYLNSDGLFADSVGTLTGGLAVVAPVTPGPSPTLAAVTTLKASASSPTYGQPLTFTATVAASPAGALTPTGTIQFLIDGEPFGAPVRWSGASPPAPRSTRSSPARMASRRSTRVMPASRPAAPGPTSVSVAPTPASVFVTTLYRELLGRIPDPLGLQDWVGRLAAGTRPAVIARDIARSHERMVLVHKHKAPKVSEARALAAALKASGYRKEHPDD